MQATTSATPAPPAADTSGATAATALTAAALLAACGGASPGAGPAASPGASVLGTVVRADAISDAEAARFLAQAAMASERQQIAAVQQLGYAGWLDAQFALPPSGTRWDWLVAKGYNASTNKNSEAGFDAAAWRKLITAPDTLRQRVTLALSEIIVVAIDGLVGLGWRAFSAAAWLDLLEAHAFGNYRALLGAVSTSVAMGQFLTFRGNSKANPATGSHPDENYARELMQLFTIGLVQLNGDGTPKLAAGTPVATYGPDDVSGLARIFTGWDVDLTGTSTATPDFIRRPMRQYPARHETGPSSFLGHTVPSGLSGADALQAALDIIYAHPNVAPFISRQLIQRLVTSNPSPAYVARVAAVFNDDGQHVRGNLRAVLKAVLLDPEARAGVSAATTGEGKLREPMLRFTGWARAAKASSATDSWAIGNTSNPATRLGQSPLRSPSVFNFFRPGYVPPNSGIAAAGLVAPEFQIANESSVIGYLNFMQRVVAVGVADVLPDYSAWLPLADNATALLAELNTVLAAGQIGGATQSLMLGALNAMPSGSDARRLNRVRVALLLVLAAPEFLVLK
ncbi:DUF1800 domain-containing protein [Rugamonas apoptosis]|uniref:DUF1800 domain-containing protein n=1 Tax=Rugamonas apoptosis TaxID=2758570 RepID=A0A7W2F9G6_9BURK|nr:DUF1800 domain-containing protein [Rugamonas apoptosis]MBA5687578.1 DUF1800 domain-containing protein [Rugamonas apoptosis]